MERISHLHMKKTKVISHVKGMESTEEQNYEMLKTGKLHE
jgi:hypothetical protein